MLGNFKEITENNLLEIEGGASFSLMVDPSKWGNALVDWWESLVS